MRSGKGARVTDTDGMDYIDYCLGYGPLILGHANPKVAESISKQARRSILLGTPTELETMLAVKIRDAIPSMEMLRFVNSGTEATMHALRLARGFTGRRRVIKMEGCYHGSHDYVLIKSGSGALTHGVPSSPGIPEEVSETVRIAKYNNMESVKEIFDNEPEGIAALIIEPIMANAGVILPENGFLRELRRITSENGSLLIFDEVVTGFRFHYGAYSSMIGVSPDLTILGKIIGGGTPIGAFGGRRDIMSALSPSGSVYQAGTFSGNPLTMAAGNAALDELSAMDYSALGKLLDRAVSGIREKFSQAGMEVAVNSMVSMFQFFPGVTCVANYEDAMRADSGLYGRIFSGMLKEGIYLASSQFETNFLSFSHSVESIDETVNALEKVIRSAEAEIRS